MAADYIREIRAIQPHGPYLIAGECVGGICAHEIACQLRDAGEDVGMLLLLDTSTPNLAELEDYLRAEEQKRAAESRPPGLAQRVRMMLGAAARRILGRTSPSAPVQHPRGQAEYPVTLMRHTLRPYRGRISMLVDAEAYGFHGKLGWDKIEGVELDIHVLPGTHITYIRDNNEAAAAKLRELLGQSF
jgi:thioesterase domain-containing protein